MNRKGLNERELASLRLLGDKGRSEMVQALMEKSMSMQELATHLGLNPGTVFRNLNSLTSAELFDQGGSGETGIITGLISRLSRLFFQHMLDFYQKEAPSARVELPGAPKDAQRTDPVCALCIFWKDGFQSAKSSSVTAS